MTMFRTILEYFTQRSIDRNAPLPIWLRWIQHRDVSLLRYESDARELDQMLQTSARICRSELAVGFSEPNALASGDLGGIVVANTLEASANGSVRLLSRQNTRYARLGWLAATAAALVGVAAFVNHNNEQRTKSEQVRLVSTQVAAMPDEMLAVITEAARTPRDYSPLNRLSLPQVNLWKDLPRGAQGQLKQTMNTWGTQWTAIGERVYERFDFTAESELN